MKQHHLLFVFAAGASVCSAQSHSKNPTKAELASHNPPVTGVFAPSPLGGGSDNCINAATQDAISGLGNFSVDMTAATTSAGTNPGCGSMTLDVWFQWTSTVTGTVEVQLCGHAVNDTVLAVWGGAGCPGGTPIVCNDDSCGLISFVSFSAVSGTQYMIQVGMYNGYPGELTSMDIGTPPPPPANDDCTTPIALPPGPQTVNFDTTHATTGAQGQGEAACADYSTTAIGKDIWFTWTPTAGGPVTVSTCGLMTQPTFGADTKIAVYDGVACPVTAALACNDDEGHSPSNPTYTCAAYDYNSTLTFTAVCGQSYTIQIGQYPFNVDDNAGAFQITENGTVCSTPSVSFCSGDVVGTTCTNCVPANNGAAGHGCANSSFATGALLTNSGNASVGTDTLVLTCSSMTGPGLFFQANGTVGGAVFGDGMLCAALGIIRMGVVFPGPPSPANTASYPGGLTPNPISIAGAPIAAGNTKHYQCWYRDAVAFCSSATFNTSNGISLTWIP